MIYIGCGDFTLDGGREGGHSCLGPLSLYLHGLFSWGGGGGASFYIIFL